MQKTILSLFLNVMYKSYVYFLYIITIKSAYFFICYKRVTHTIFRYFARKNPCFMGLTGCFQVLF